MNSSKRLTLTLIVLAIALIAVGCGGSDSDGSDGAVSSSSVSSTTSDETPSLTKAEFIKQADAACKKGSKEVQTEFAAYLKENKIKEIGEGKESKAEAEGRIEEVIEAAIPTLHQQLDAIRALDAPAADEAQVKAYLEAAEAGIEKGEEDPQAMFTSTAQVFAKSDKLAGEIGFKVCGNR